MGFLVEMSDGFWGALVGALITGTAGIIIVVIQLTQNRKQEKNKSKKEIRFYIFYLNKCVEIITLIAKEFETIECSIDTWTQLG
ncbi:hypothetical protein ACERJO_20845 [Halalkalibacter sp. AB-rgal2]|uniref:hypothetical protein n=1 Tax=Halalkalibacter sp. AB-rgal2 TaxID=3242695 RepID=UPI00359D20E6